MQCPECESTHIRKNGIRRGKQNNICADCGRQFVAQCITPRTFSQKLYQLQALEIAEEFEQALDEQSLVRIKELLDKVLEKDIHFPTKSYYSTKNFATTVGTVGASIFASNVVTPVLRNTVAADIHNKYFNHKVFHHKVHLYQRST